MKNFFCSAALRHFTGHSFAILLVWSTACGQTQRTVKSSHGSTLTSEITDHYISIYEYLLDVRLTLPQRTRIETGLIQCWESNNLNVVQQILSDLKYYGKKDELEELRSTSQQVFADAFRNDRNDSISRIWAEAYDLAHPERTTVSSIKTLNDLTGRWESTNGVIAEKTYEGQPAGISYTDVEAIEVNSNGRFKHTKVHSHYEGSCSQVDGTTEYGIVKIENNKLIFDVDSGSEMISDECFPSLNQKIIINRHANIFVWTIRNNLNNVATQTLCLNGSNSSAICLDKK